jgi:crotonobetainyl-CoA:carnitine CoA-transferase CaiB-like acyl-CoA transferase
MLIQAEVGLVSITGTADGPSRAGISVADIAAGMYAFSGVLTALLARSTSGQGSAINVSLLDALGEWMGAPAYYTGYSGVEPPRSGAAHATIAPYELFVSQDGVEIVLAVQNNREWARLCADVLGRPDLASDARFATNAARVSNRVALREIVEPVLQQLPVEAIVTRLEAAGIASAPRNTVAEFLQHPQLAARGRWRTIDSPSGPLRALAPPIDIAGVEPVLGPVPSLGQHTDAILREWGFDAATIAAWRKEQMI